MLFLLQGSPLQARQDKSYYMAAIIAAGIAVLAILVNLIIQAAKRNSSSGRDANKTTTPSIINRVAAIYELSLPEKDFLLKICRKKKIPNLEVNLRSEQFGELFFSEQYHDLKENADISEDELQNNLALLFSIHQKVDNSLRSLSNLTSTSNFPEGGTVQYYSDNKEQFPLQILSVQKDGLWLSIPRDVLNNEVRPPELSKINLFYQTKTNTAYLAAVRVLRYQKTTDSGEMVVNHCNNLQRYQRRQYKRIAINRTCRFSSVKVTTGGSGENAKITYTPLENQYQGTLLELSVGGCSILTTMNIKPNQYIHLYLSVNGLDEDEITGIIVNTDVSPETDRYVLHILFLKVSKKTRNRIFTKVYDYV